MRTVIVNSRGKVMPTRIHKEHRDITPVAFDFSLLLPSVDSYTVEGDMPITGDAQDGTTVTVTLDEGQAQGLYDLAVIASGGGETRAATIQIKVEDRERGWNAWPYYGYGYGAWW